jgi:hypothetical protein
MALLKGQSGFRNAVSKNFLVCYQAWIIFCIFNMLAIGITIVNWYFYENQNTTFYIFMLRHKIPLELGKD